MLTASGLGRVRKCVISWRGMFLDAMEGPEQSGKGDKKSGS